MPTNTNDSETPKKSVVITNTGVGIEGLNPKILRKQINEIREVLKGYDQSKQKEVEKKSAKA